MTNKLKATESHPQVLVGGFHAPRRRYQRPLPEEEEAILALYSLTESFHEVARLTGWSRDIIRRVIEEAEVAGVLHEKRVAHREQIIDQAWMAIMMAIQTTLDGLRKGYVSGEAIDPQTGEPVCLVSRISPAQAAGVLQKLHRIVHANQPKSGPLVEQIAAAATEEELVQELEKLYGELMARRGSLG